MNGVRAVYRIRGASDVARRARFLALEQTVELAEAAVEREILDHVAGRIQEITTEDGASHRVTVTYPDAGGGGLAALMNVLFGNASLQDDVELLDFDLDAEARERFAGPAFGIRGIREATGVHGRPLTCAALKPVGASTGKLAERCRAFALAGVDVIKDDHGFADREPARLAARIETCCRAVREAAEKTGRRTLYAPNLTGPPEEIERGLDLARKHGAGAVLVEPMLIGVPFVHHLARCGAGMPLIAHPSWAGAPRISPEAVLGRLFRLAGADAVIYPHHGGRFPYDEGTCRRLAGRLRKPWGRFRATLPVPAGGMEIHRMPELTAFYGPDTMFLLGGTLYTAGPSPEALEKRARRFVEAVAEAARTNVERKPE